MENLFRNFIFIWAFLFLSYENCPYWFQSLAEVAKTYIASDIMGCSPSSDKFPAGEGVAQGASVPSAKQAPSRILQDLQPGQIAVDVGDKVQIMNWPLKNPSNQIATARSFHPSADGGRWELLFPDGEKLLLSPTKVRNLRPTGANQWVRIVGVEHSKELNGLYGKTMEQVKGSRGADRWHCQVLGRPENLSLKVVNLVVVTQATAVASLSTTRVGAQVAPAAFGDTYDTYESPFIAEGEGVDTLEDPQWRWSEGDVEEVEMTTDTPTG